jgi:hypothetical protein
MTNEEFVIEVEKSFLRSKSLLIKKGVEYSQDGDRLGQFHRAGAAQGVSPTQALMGMAMKHVTSLADMVKYPKRYSRKAFNEKITDLRNYTFLLDALLRDLEIE